VKPILTPRRLGSAAIVRIARKFVRQFGREATVLSTGYPCKMCLHQFPTHSCSALLPGIMFRARMRTATSLSRTTKHKQSRAQEMGLRARLFSTRIDISAAEDAGRVRNAALAGSLNTGPQQKASSKRARSIGTRLIDRRTPKELGDNRIPSCSAMMCDDGSPRCTADWYRRRAKAITKHLSAIGETRAELLELFDNRLASPGGTCIHWKAPPCHGAHPKRTAMLPGALWGFECGRRGA
jgi:hypothetical protein